MAVLNKSLLICKTILTRTYIISASLIYSSIYFVGIYLYFKWHSIVLFLKHIIKYV